MQFEIDDEEYDPGANLPSAVSRILDVIQSMPAGKLYTTARLAREIGCIRGTVLNYTAHPALKEHKIISRNKNGRCNLFGNAETIRAYRREAGIE